MISSTLHNEEPFFNPTPNPTAMNRFSLLFALLASIWTATEAQTPWYGNAPSDSEPSSTSLRPMSGAEPAFWYLPEILGAGPAVYTDVAPEGYQLAESQSCVAQIVAFDPYCLNTGWDDLCDEEYACCLAQDELFQIGCTNSGACNYNPDACYSDPTSCVFCLSNCWNLTLTDSYGDGWNGGSWSLLDGDGLEVAGGTLEDGFAGVQAGCVDDGCYTFSVVGGDFSFEVGWILDGADGGQLSGGADETVPVSFNATAGCTTPYACNYDASACLDDGSCTFVDTPPTDMTATSWELFYDFGCTGLPQQATLYFDADQTLSDDEGSSAQWSLCGDVLKLATAEGMTIYEGSWDGLGFAGLITLLEGGCFELYPTSLGCTDATACNYDAEATVFDGSCTYPGCMNPLGCNYDATAGCEGPCDLPAGYLEGCTNAASSNYNPSATVDDGSCDLSHLCLEGTVYDLELMGCVPAACPGDMNYDGEIDVNDLLDFLVVYDSVCE
jgi:hypothetical protein